VSKRWRGRRQGTGTNFLLGPRKKSKENLFQKKKAMAGKRKRSLRSGETKNQRSEKNALKKRVIEERGEKHREVGENLEKEENGVT